LKIERLSRAGSFAFSGDCSVLLSPSPQFAIGTIQSSILELRKILANCSTFNSLCTPELFFLFGFSTHNFWGNYAATFPDEFDHFDFYFAGLSPHPLALRYLPLE